MKMFLYEIEYTSDGYHSGTFTSEIVAENEGDAIDIAMKEDYYFGKLISCREVREATSEELTI